MAIANVVQTYYVPIREEDLIASSGEGDFEILSGNDNTDTADLFSIISFAIAAPNTQIIYDHWEDGYDPDPTNPSDTTIVFGDGDLSNNGGFIVDENGDDIFEAGETFFLVNEVPTSRQDDADPAFLFDGSDKISASFPIAVTRAAYAETPGTPLAGATEVFDTDRYGDRFVVPVGTDTDDVLPDDTDSTSVVSAHVMASQDGTEIFLNGVSQGTVDTGDSIVLRQLSEGDVITTSDEKPAQVHLITGDEGDEYETRWFALQPVDDWSNDYYTPTFTGEQTAQGGSENSVSGSGPTQVQLFNPGDSDITVNYDFAGGSSPDGTITVPAGGSAFSPIIPNDSGARFFTDDEADVFFALSFTDTSGTGNRNDWGHPLIPADQLTSQVLIALGAGNQPILLGNASNGTDRSTVWVTPTEDAEIFVDYGDGNGAQSLGNVGALSSIRVNDTDNDMSGAQIFALDSNGQPVNIAVSYGQDSQNSSNISNFEQQSIDFGTVIPALPEIAASKGIELTNDADGDGKFSVGDTVTYTIEIINFGRVDIAAGGYTITDFSIPIFDDVTDGDGEGPLTYVAGSTVYDPTPEDPNNGDEVDLDDDANPNSAFPLDENGFTNTDTIEAGTSQTLTFEATIDNFEDLQNLTTEFTNRGVLTNNNSGFIDDFEVTRPLNFTPGIDIEKTTNGEQADTGTGPELIVGEDVTWEYTVTNTGDTAIANVEVTDSDIGVTPVFQSGDTDGDGILDIGETWIYEATGTAAVGQYENIGSVTGDAAYANNDSNGDPVLIPDANGGGGVDDDDRSAYFGVSNGSVGDFVFEDLDGDGVQDQGEPGIEGVTVNLLQNGQVVQTVLTDANGGYTFTGLPAGNYQVEFEQPTGFEGSPANAGNDDDVDSDGIAANGFTTPTFTLPQGGNITNIDQGFFKPATIGDFVFADTDGDGVQDNGEAGVGGVVVNLLDGNGQPVLDDNNNPVTTVTASDGSYSFNVDPGTYQVEFENPDGTSFSPADQGGDDAADSDADPTTGVTPSVTVQSGETNNTLDAGIIQPQTLSGRVFEDDNANGIDNADDGIGGVTVNLLDGNGQPVLDGSNNPITTTTGSDGSYSFTVLPGDYQVSFDRPNGFSGTSPQDAGNDDTVDSDGDPATLTTATVTVPAGQNVTDVDQGLFKPAIIGDAVFSDTDGDGIQDAGEDGVSGVTVNLLDENGNPVLDGSNNPVTTTTDGDGNYSFNVDPGTYQVEFEKPDGSEFSPLDQGGDDAEDSDADLSTGRSPNVTVGSGETNDTIDAGLIVPASIEGTLFEDQDADGQEDGVGIPGATVSLLDGNGDPVLDGSNNPITTTTDANGDYKFDGVAPGDYQVAFERPAGFTGTSPQNVGDDATDSDGNTTTLTTASFTVESGDAVKNVDQGLFKPVTIGDFIFTDTDEDGIQDPGEQGREGVTVNLLDENGNVLETVVTGPDGSYSFTRDPGTYQVQVEAPDGTFFSPQDQGGDDAADSDADPADGKLGTPITLTSGQSDDTQDAGLVDAQPGLSLVKSITAVDTAGNQTLDAAGDVIEYQLTVENTGNVALNNVTITDPLTGVSQNIGSLNPGQSQSIDTSYTLTQADLDSNATQEPDDVAAGLLDNTAAAVSDETPDPVKDSEDEPVVQNPDIAFDKQVVAVDEAGDGRANNAGEIIKYALVVTNTGNVTLTNVTVVDPLLGGTLETIASLAPGASETVTGEYTVTQEDLDGAGNAGQDFDIDNTATADSDQTDPVSDTEEVPLGDPELDIFKVICGVDKDGNGVIDNVGETIDYQLMVVNTGTALLTNVVVTDPLTGVDQNLGTLKPGEMRTINTSYEVTAADFDANGTLEPDNVLPGTIDNTARADSDQTDEVSDDAIVKIVTKPGIGFDKAVKAVDAAGDGKANAVGDIIEYTLTVTNTGNVTLTNVTVVDPLTGTSEVIPSLAAGASQTFHADYAITQEDIDTNGGGDGDIDNTATADSDQTGPVDDHEEVPLEKADKFGDKCSDIEDHFVRPDEKDATIHVGQGLPHQNGTNGDDFVVGDNTANTISVNGGENTVLAKGGDDIVNGGNQADYVFGDAGNDILNGNGGDDSLSGGKGDDKLYGAHGNDKILAGAGDDLVEAGEGCDIVNAGKGNDTVQGEGGDDCIAGGKDDGFITGTLKTGLHVVLGDELFGNGGADRFEYSSGDGVDFLFDFKAEDGDTLKLHGIDEDDVTFAEANT
ncbi:MAG: SdrD B-like domain-containing protein, partial [Pseudomonadota bacterium]